MGGGGEGQRWTWAEMVVVGGFGVDIPHRVRTRGTHRHAGHVAVAEAAGAGARELLGDDEVVEVREMAATWDFHSSFSS